MKRWLDMDTKKQETLKFEMSVEETKAYKEFLIECHQELLENQIKEFKNHEDPNLVKEWEMKTGEWTMPYTGAIGGLVSIIITPTSLGNAFTLRCNFLNKEKDVTDYSYW